MPHLLDSLAGLLYRFGPGSTRVFPEGWGDRLTVEMLADSSSLTSAPVPAADTVWGRKEERVGLRVIRGQFTSPVAELLPPAARVVPVELLEPAVGSSRVVVLLPAWNDHGFDQRRKMAHELVEQVWLPVPDGQLAWGTFFACSANPNGSQVSATVTSTTTAELADHLLPSP